MTTFNEKIQTFNATIRTLLAAVVVGGGAVAAWFGYGQYTKPQRELDQAKQRLNEVMGDLKESRTKIANQEQEIGDLEKDVAEKAEHIARLRTSLRLLKVDHRIAQLTVIKQTQHEEEGVSTTLEFVEINDEGAPIDEPKIFEIEGDMVYIEAKVVHFEDQFVEQADVDRSTSLCLFTRVFGEYQEPQEGYALDQAGVRPTAYARGGKMSSFEEKVWSQFWDIANDKELAGQLGVRAAQSEAPGMKVRPGHVYRIMLRASGGLTWQISEKPLEDAPDAPGV